MNPPRLNTLFVALVVLVIGLLFYSPGHAGKSLAQDSDKSLDITRHANEPLELVDIKVSEQSVTDKIKVKHRSGDESREGLDKVEFQDKDDWFKRLRIKLRNVSGKTIVGMQAYLYFKPPGSKVLFSTSLKGSTQLEHAVLEQGAEIEIMVDNGSFDRTVIRLKQHGWDVNSAAVTCSVEIVAFSDGIQWHKGHNLRIDPDNPNRRRPIYKVLP
jgi:hypothetical protein